MDIFYNIIKKSDKNRLELLSNEIYKINRFNSDYWDFMIQNTILENKLILSNLDNINIKLLINRQKLNNDILINDKFISIINKKKLYNYIIKDQFLNNDILNTYIYNFPDICWEDICKYQNLTIEFMEKHINNLHWDIISENQLMTLEFIVKYKEKIKWDVIGQNIKLEYLFNDTFVNIFSKYNIWNILIWSNNISKVFLLQNLDKLNNNLITELLKYKKLDEDIINIILSKNKDKLEFYKIITEDQDLSMEFIRNNISKLDMDTIIENQNITYDFIKENISKINIKKLSYNDNLTEELLLSIYKIKDKFNTSLDWNYISEYCFLTKKSISQITELNKELILENINIKL